MNGDWIDSNLKFWQNNELAMNLSSFKELIVNIKKFNLE